MSPFRAELFLLDSKFLGKKETLKIRVVRRKIFISHWEENAERTKKNEKSSFRRTTEIIFVQISRASVRKSKRFENRSDFSKFRSKNSSVRLRREHFSRTGARRLSNFDREKSPRNVQRSAFFSPNFHEIRARLGDYLRRYSTIFRSQTIFLRRNEKKNERIFFSSRKNQRNHRSMFNVARRQIDSTVFANFGFDATNFDENRWTKKSKNEISTEPKFTFSFS